MENPNGQKPAGAAPLKGGEGRHRPDRIARLLKPLFQIAQRDRPLPLKIRGVPVERTADPFEVREIDVPPLRGVFGRTRRGGVEKSEGKLSSISQHLASGPRN